MDFIYLDLSQDLWYGPPQCSCCSIGDIYLMDKELADWLHPKNYSPWLNVQLETSKTLCPSRVYTGTDIIQYFFQQHRVRLSRLSASLLVTPSCVVHLTSHREYMPSRGTLTAWMNEAMENSRAQQGQEKGPSGQFAVSIQTGGWVGWGQPCGEGLADEK